jgi:hypothetical protein
MKCFGVSILCVVYLLVRPSGTTVRAEEERFSTKDAHAAGDSNSPPRFDPQKQENEKTPPSADQIAGWIKKLDDPLYQVREEATQHLTEAEGAALDPLLSAANGDRPEPADRAVWIMRRFSRSRNGELAMAALEHLIQVENQPTVVAKALSELAERNIAACEAKLVPLGADLNVQIEPIDPPNAAPVLTLRLGDRWHGTTEDLRQLAELKQQKYFRLEGAAINDEVAKYFAGKEKLAVLQLFDTKVSAAAVDALKEKHPDAIIYLRNQALLGVSAENNPAGVRVMFVQPNSAAEKAGIKQGDIIATIEGHKLPDFDRLTARIAQHQPGDKIDIEIVRFDQSSKQNETVTLNLMLGSRNPQE